MWSVVWLPNMTAKVMAIAAAEGRGGGDLEGFSPRLICFIGLEVADIGHVLRKGIVDLGGPIGFAAPIPGFCSGWALAWAHQDLACR